MSTRKSDEGSWGRRKSGLFTLSSLASSSIGRSTSTSSDDPSSRRTKTLARKHKHVRSPSTLRDPTDPETVSLHNTMLRSASDEPQSENVRRPSLSTKVSRRTPSVFGTLKTSVRASSEELGYFGSAYAIGEPLSSTSSKAPSLSFENALDGVPLPKLVLLHGEVQTSAGMFRKKREYLVLTEVHLFRYKSHQKAAETFKSISNPYSVTKSPTARHAQMPSAGSQSDLQTVSDSSGDKDGRIALRHVVATHRLEDGKPYFALEVCFFDDESGQASAMTLQLGTAEERDVWLNGIRRAAHENRLNEDAGISTLHLETAARVVERDCDYDPSNCAVFKVVQRQSTSRLGSRPSSDDLTKAASNVCFLAIGVHKVHLIQQSKAIARSSSPSLTVPSRAQSSYGILTLIAVKVSDVDDTIELTFRQPMQRPKTLSLATYASHEIMARLHFSENFLRPESRHRLFRYSAPSEVEEFFAPPAASDVEENSCLDRTLIAYCVAYGVNPSNFRYSINHGCEDAPRFELLPPADVRKPTYDALELLSIMRSLRYNESFGSLSFAGIALDALIGLNDGYGHEHVCTRTKRGTPIKLTFEELSRSSLLVQEIRALAATSKRLRRLDFSGCIAAKNVIPDATEDEPARVKDVGCGIVEALFPLCKHQTTNVDWICLNGIELTETDLDYLVGAAVDKSCHFRAIELNRCGLNDRSLGLILDALRAQENTLESLEIAGNAARLNPGTFDGQLAMFGFIRKLNLSNMTKTSSAEPFLQTETLFIWRLQELRLSGTTLNSATVDAISTYLAHPQSDSLHELHLDNTYLSGTDVATILYSLSHDSEQVRSMHLDISQCLLSKGLEAVTQAIASGKTPAYLSMRAIEYQQESQFRKLITAVAANKTVKCLDMSQTALPGDAGDDTCKSLSKLLAENSSLIELNLSGDDSRLATSKFGSGVNDALAGLKQNNTLQVFRIEKQRLGFQGASTLAEVLRENSTLRELHCDNNEIPLHGLTDLVNALHDNTSLIFLPTMNDGRAAAFRAAETTMKVMADQEAPIGLPTVAKTASFTATSAVKRGLATVKKTAQRTASVRSPSFPSQSRLSSSSRPAPPSLSLRMRHHSPSASLTAPLSSFTVQDIQTTHSLLSEQWDRQCLRLERCLDRNWCLLHQIPCAAEPENDRFERPESTGSIGKMLEQIRFDSTPKAEKESFLFDSPVDDGDPHAVGFERFLLDGSVAAAAAVVVADPEMSLVGEQHFDQSDTSTVDGLDEPRTPTQKARAAAATATA